MRIYDSFSPNPTATPDAIRAWVSQAIERGVDDPAVLKDQPGGRVVAVGDGDEQFVVKLYMVSPVKAWLYHVVRRSRAWRECSGAAALTGAGVRVARPVALIDRPGGGWSQALVLPYVRGVTLYAWLARGDASETDRRAVFTAVGRQIGAITGAGLVNRDHKPANLMVDPELPGGEPTLLDPAGIRRRTGSRVRRMFALLHETTMRHPGVTADDFAACVEAARSVDPTLTAEAVGVA